jgi:hypothetical protein
MSKIPRDLIRILLSALQVGGTIASFVLDWRTNHLLSPEWAPHARFHGGLFLFSMAGVAIISLWLLWRRSSEPRIGVIVAALLLLAYWTPLFYVNSLVPGSSLWAGAVGHEPRWGTVIVYPNLVFAGAFVVLSIFSIGAVVSWPNIAPEPTRVAVPSPTTEGTSK